MLATTCFSYEVTRRCEQPSLVTYFLTSPSPIATAIPTVPLPQPCTFPVDDEHRLFYLSVARRETMVGAEDLARVPSFHCFRSWFILPRPIWRPDDTRLASERESRDQLQRVADSVCMPGPVNEVTW